MSTIITIPPVLGERELPADQHPQQTRLVEANWKASALVAEAPLPNSDRAMATAA